MHVVAHSHVQEHYTFPWRVSVRIHPCVHAPYISPARACRCSLLCACVHKHLNGMACVQWRTRINVCTLSIFVMRACMGSLVCARTHYIFVVRACGGSLANARTLFISVARACRGSLACARTTSIFAERACSAHSLLAHYIFRGRVRVRALSYVLAHIYIHAACV